MPVRLLFVPRGQHREYLRQANAARAKLAALTRGTGRLDSALGRGRPVLAAESQSKLETFQTGVAGRWVCIRAKHRLTEKGVTVRWSEVEATQMSA